MKTKKTLKEIKLDNKAMFSKMMDKKKEKYEKIDLNKSTEQLKIKKRNHSLALQEKRMEKQVSATKLKFGEEK